MAEKLPPFVYLFRVFPINHLKPEPARYNERRFWLELRPEKYQ
jgi:hypothetical protein